MSARSSVESSPSPSRSATTPAANASAVLETKLEDWGPGYTGAMHPLLLAADDCRLCSDELIELGSRLPKSAEECDELLATVVEQSLDRAFTHLSLAALQRQLPVDARHLQGGAHLLPDPDIVARLAGHCQGDVAGALVEAVKEGRLSWEREGVALLLGAWWDQEKRGGQHAQGARPPGTSPLSQVPVAERRASGRGDGAASRGRRALGARVVAQSIRLRGGGSYDAYVSPRSCRSAGDGGASRAAGVAVLGLASDATSCS